MKKLFTPTAMIARAERSLASNIRTPPRAAYREVPEIGVEIPELGDVSTAGQIPLSRTMTDNVRHKKFWATSTRSVWMRTVPRATKAAGLASSSG